ncbi:hypothetical protein CBM2586_A40015 [Cupriavidus phytorum]|uniref:Uncharacterized protein n=1 Tax=Cupriavidus taiwanensis TaxID=164546 RepID=A0A375C2E2_9BURK|nr:hypothetical protein CBM2586_A40015 [Cupriavidus taiwanensis]
MEETHDTQAARIAVPVAVPVAGPSQRSTAAGHCRGAARHGPRGRASRRLARAAHHHHRAGRARRHHRYPDAAGGAEAVGHPRPAGGGRQQARQRRHHRHAGLHARRAGRLHAAGRQYRLARHQLQRLQAVVLPAAGFPAADRPDLVRQRAGGRRAGTGAQRGRAGGAAQAVAGQVLLCLGRHRPDHPPDRRTVPAAHRHRGHPRAVQGLDAGHHLGAGGRNHLHVRQPDAGAAADPRRQAARAGGDQRRAPARAARRAHHGAGRRQGFRGDGLAGLLRPGQDPAGGGRGAAGGAGQGHARSRGGGALARHGRRSRRRAAAEVRRAGARRDPALGRNHPGIEGQPGLTPQALCRAAFAKSEGDPAQSQIDTARRRVIPSPYPAVYSVPA